MCLDNISFGELYQLQKETQLELCDREEIIHDDLQMVNLENERYVEECTTLQREKEEVEQFSTRLKTEKEEVEQVYARLKEEKEQV